MLKLMPIVLILIMFPDSQDEYRILFQSDQKPE